MSTFAKASADSLRILYFGRVFGEIWLSSVLACQPEPSQRLAERVGFEPTVSFEDNGFRDLGDSKNEDDESSEKN